MTFRVTLYCPVPLDWLGRDTYQGFRTDLVEEVGGCTEYLADGHWIGPRGNYVHDHVRVLELLLPAHLVDLAVSRFVDYLRHLGEEEALHTIEEIEAHFTPLEK